MIDFWEVVKQCSVGEVIDERDYDRLLWKNISELVNKYDIEYDPENIITAGNKLADRAYEAAIELFLNLGFSALIPDSAEMNWRPERGLGYRSHSICLARCVRQLLATLISSTNLWQLRLQGRVQKCFSANCVSCS